MKFGLTQPFECSYLTEQQEQLLVLVNEEQQLSDEHYQLLLNSGFRRSGEQVYRPHCPSCNACQSLRIPVRLFKPSKSQKRVLNKSKDLDIRYSRRISDAYYPLYADYIEQRHADGSMYPPDPQQFYSFIQNQWLSCVYIEFYQQQELVAVAVTDEVDNAFSALYTFFKPELEHRSIGTLAILQQILLAQTKNKPYLYLGYQIDSCQKMNYKQKFLPHERFFANKWHLITKK